MPKPNNSNDTRDRRDLDAILERADGRLSGIDAGRVAHLAQHADDRSVRRDARLAFKAHRDEPAPDEESGAA